MKRKIFVVVLIFSIFALWGISQMKNKAFAPAGDFPRGALIYAQINDLPAAVKLWNESKLKEKYAASENFAFFRNNHLGRKLASRRQEFNNAAGFEFDLETVSTLAESKAAFALYDVGKLEFVFIAPVPDEIFAATKFALNRDKFIAETLADGTTIYRATVEADRGRQRQELIFTNLKNRFVLATSEKLLVQTLQNISGDRTKNRLTDEPAFAALSEKIEPHLATVWVDQALLNEDYYLRRYWLMSDAADLKNIRAGIFDLEIREGKIIERRKFLLYQTENVPSINPAAAEKMLSHLPENIPFYTLQAANSQLTNETVRKTIFDRQESALNYQAERKIRYSSGDYDHGWRDYGSLGEKFDESIDESEENDVVLNRETTIDFFEILRAANPRAVLTFTEPKLLPAPLFIEFHRAAIFHLAAPENFNRNAFEASILRKFSAKVLINAPTAKFEWKTVNENNLAWRELNLPLTGWKASYILRGGDLILTDDSEILREILETEPVKTNEKFEKSFALLKVINLDQRKTAFDDIFGELAKKEIAESFFTDNIGSLLDSITEVEKIEAVKRQAANLLEEEVIASFR